MYIPDWLIIAAIIIGIVVIFRYKKGILAKIETIEDVERRVPYFKDEIFALEHFDSPHFIDLQDSFDAMEINYFRLKQRLFHDQKKVLEVAKDWLNYVDSLSRIKHGRMILDVDWSENAWDKAEQRLKEPSIIKDEIEKKFKELLKQDWQSIPPDFFKREETMKKPILKKGELFVDWKYYYKGSKNLINLLTEKAEKEKTKSINN